MLGHALLMFTPEEEDRVLTGKLHHCMVLDEEGYQGRGCLLQVAQGTCRPGGRFSFWRRDIEHTIAGENRIKLAGGNFIRWTPRHGSVGHRYDALCQRFGVTRIGQAIRSRILTNQVRRALQPQAVEVAS